MPPVPPQFTASELIIQDPFLVFLETPEAQELWQMLEACKGDVLRIKERHVFLGRMTQLWHTRREHADRFALAARMMMTPTGAQQATGDAIAQYKTTWAKGAWRILMACSGIGGELMALAKVYPEAEIIAVDASREVLAAAAWNTRLVGGDRVRFVHALLEDVLPSLGTFDHAFVDPDRRPGGQRRVRMEDYLPSPTLVLPDLRAQCGQVHMKVSPMVQDPQAECLTWIAEGKTLKECVLHWGGTYPAAVQIDAGKALSFTVSSLAPARSLSSKPFLLELSPALLRAGLVQNVAEVLGAQQIHPASSVLIGNAEPSPFLRRYEILEEMPYAPKLLKQRFKGQSLVVKKRFFPLEPAAIRQQLGIKEGGDLILYCTTREPQARVAFLCRLRQD